MYITGRKPVLELLKRNPADIKKIIIKESNSEIIKDIKKECTKKKIRIEVLNADEYENYNLIPKQNSQGVVAITGEFKYVKTSDIIRANINNSNSVLVIIDEVQDPQNVGSIIRTCVASGADGVIMTDKNTPDINHTVIKASAGAVNYIPVSKEKNIYKTIELLKYNRYMVIGTATNAEEVLYNFSFPDKCVFIFGNEARGIRKNIIKLCDCLIKIPMNGEFNSLNVSVAAGIVLFEILRQRKLNRNI